MPSSSKKSHRVNLARAPEIARGAILEQIARDEGIAVEDIQVEG